MVHPTTHAVIKVSAREVDMHLEMGWVFGRKNTELSI